MVTEYAYDLIREWGFDMDTYPQEIQQVLENEYKHLRHPFPNFMEVMYNRIVDIILG